MLNTTRRLLVRISMTIFCLDIHSTEGVQFSGLTAVFSRCKQPDLPILNLSRQKKNTSVRSFCKTLQSHQHKVRVRLFKGLRKSRLIEIISCVPQGSTLVFIILLCDYSVLFLPSSCKLHFHSGSTVSYVCILLAGQTLRACKMIQNSTKVLQGPQAGNI